ncbi:uncharacterized protein SCHCODRAFT_02558838 [Schizophyllum commune H4-8]|uniref:uncharacterized protein n=1 Tax=Schizophyllum commune (strain H4-8 / FGSC 9210) TaxID=578458 RepID=UPI00215E0F2A|nr:uncharacterized protein SCHCODRAFT_02558838 [Schizophyllum commune H4-8]KAI5884976.1 hypothetical protein SCHCODRAFT_02558838 [Schizophyllum commune H4-8]
MISTSLAVPDLPTSPARAEWTLNENDEDVRRMVITRGLVNQSPDVYKDSFGRAYWQLPAYYALCYVTSTSNIYYQCKKRPIDRNGNQAFFGDRCFTVFMWLERLKATLGVSEDKGLVKCELKDGRLVYVLVIAASDKPDTIPRPAARIQKFREFLELRIEPVVRRVVQPPLYD